MPTQPKRRSEKVPFTKDMKSRVKKLGKQTGWGAVSVSKRIQSNKLSGHAIATVGRVLLIMNAQNIRTVDPDLYASVVSVLEDVTTDEQALHGQAKHTGRIKIDDAFRQSLKALMERHHQMSIAKTLRLLGSPEDLSHLTVQRVLSGKQSTLKAKHYEFLAANFQGLTTR